MNSKFLFFQVTAFIGMLIFCVACTTTQPNDTSVNKTPLAATDAPLPTIVPSANSAKHPPSRPRHAMAFDSESDKAVLFGGLVSVEENLNDTWAYDYTSNTWTEMSPTESPGERIAPALAYDSESDRLILFGGLNTPNETTLDDTWVYDFNTNIWTEMKPIQSPPARHGHKMVYDSESDRIIIFSGEIGFHVKNIGGTWAYDYNSNSWEEMMPVDSPPPDNNFQMAYDIESDRTILWNTKAMENEDRSVWVYDYNSDIWEELKPNNGHPEPFSDGAMAYDVANDRTILHRNHDLWAFDYNNNIWTALEPSSTYPIFEDHSMIYDTNTNKLIVFGGGKLFDKEFIGETWVFDPETVTWEDMTSQKE